jgi:UPF0716 protein FxsA
MAPYWKIVPPVSTLDPLRGKDVGGSGRSPDDRDRHGASRNGTVPAMSGTHLAPESGRAAPAEAPSPEDRTSMFPRLVLLFVGIPLIELALLVWLGTLIGFWPTIALVLVTGLAGALLAKLAGVQVVMQIRREVMAGRMPLSHMLDGVLVLIGGVVLLTPGLLTDIFGFALLIPQTRRMVREALRRRVERMVESRRVEILGFGGRGIDVGAGPGDPPPEAPR